MQVFRYQNCFEHVHTIGSSAYTAKNNEPWTAKYGKLYHEEMYSEEEDELTPIQDAQSMGSGTMHDKEIVSAASEDQIAVNQSNDHLDNSETQNISEKNDNDNSLVAILRKREGQAGGQGWNALKQTLKDRKIDILEMVIRLLSFLIPPVSHFSWQ